MVLIIPIYNGAEYLAVTFQLLHAWIHEHPGNISRIVLVDDGSTDNTRERCNTQTNIAGVGVTVLHHETNKGKGAAIRTAFAWCLAHNMDEWYAVTDVELPYGLDALLSQTDGYVLCMGVRRGSTSTSLRRSLFSRLFHLCIPKVLRHITDTQCGIKLCSKALVQCVSDHAVTQRWVFDIELLLCAISLGAIAQVPVSYRQGFSQGSGGVRVFRHGPRIVWDMARIYWRNAWGKYA